MRFTTFITTIFFLFVAQLCAATPIAEAESSALTVSVISAKNIEFPSLSKDVPETIEFKSDGVEKAGTTPRTGFEAIAHAVDAFVICGGLSCNGQCVSYPLSRLYGPVCWGPTPGYRSAIIRQASNRGLPYYFAPGTARCANRVRLGLVNTCYRISRVVNTFYHS